MSGRAHVILVEAYLGRMEHIDAGDQRLTSHLGLPLDRLAAGLDCRVTVLDWSLWRAHEQRGGGFDRWMPFPATKPIGELPAAPPANDPPCVARHAIPAHDPETGRPFSAGLSPRSFGLLAESDPLFLASYCLERKLDALMRETPFSLVIVPMFCGLGYVAQMARGTGAGLAGTRFAVVVTGTSHERQLANGEGLWTRPAVTRRQMEDLSLALADLAIGFGPHGEAAAGRAEGLASVIAPRHFPPDLRQGLTNAARPRRPAAAVEFHLAEPLQAASGALIALDAARLLRERGARLDRPIACIGTEMVFAPAAPRGFEDYWSSRTWARQLVEEGFWRWSEPAPRPHDPPLRVRLFPSPFEFLPDALHALAAGEAVLLSPAAAEGLADPADLPAEALLPHATPEALAQRIAQWQGMDAVERENLRIASCQTVLRAHEEAGLDRRLEALLEALRTLLAGPADGAALRRAGRRLLDARPAEPWPSLQTADAPQGPPSLTVAVPCHMMGALVEETIASVWESSRIPDELLLIDDGSPDTATAEAIARLEAAASDRGLPLRVIRQTNQGLAAARNTALAAARSSHISFLDGDDLIDPRFYRLALDLAAANPWLGGVAAWAETFGVGSAPGFWNAPQPELPLLLAENTVFVPCLSPVALLRSLGGYDTGQRYNYEDWELAVRLLDAGYPILTIPRYLQRYRVRPDSLLRTMSTTQNQVMREKLLESHPALARRFGPELAMLIEYRLMRTLDRQPSSALGAAVRLPSLVGRIGGRIEQAAVRAGGLLRGRGGGR